LRAALEERGMGVTVLHRDHDVGVYAALRALRDGLVSLVPARPPSSAPASAAPSTPSMARRIRDAIVWSKLVRRMIYPIDVLLFLGVRAWVEGIQGRVLIMDRYFYDTLVDVSSGRRWGWIRALELITPTPSLPVLLGTGPEAAYARKREYSVDYLRTRWWAYRRVFLWVRDALELRNDDPGVAQVALRWAVLGRLRTVPDVRPALEKRG
ncbi:MAG TPA: hypothetical protein VFD76_08410, partial [Gemmatimonadales bacterium]|nr:hypothetical protein [Gemmatimonadales bacterium]